MHIPGTISAALDKVHLELPPVPIGALTTRKESEEGTLIRKLEWNTRDVIGQKHLALRHTRARSVASPRQKLKLAFSLQHLLRWP